MNIQKFTQKSMQAIQDCEKLAYEYGNQEIEQEHMLVALMRQEDGLIPMLIEKMEINKQMCIRDSQKTFSERWFDRSIFKKYCKRCRAYYWRILQILSDERGTF